MAAIDVEQLEEREDAWVFRVAVSEGESETAHRVRVPKEYFAGFQDAFTSPRELVRASFAFLLARESKESILTQFELPLISKYFPEYEREIPRYAKPSVDR